MAGVEDGIVKDGKGFVVGSGTFLEVAIGNCIVTGGSVTLPSECLYYVFSCDGCV